MTAPSKNRVASEQTIPANYVKKGTMWTVALVALVAGFLIGTAVTVYKSLPEESTPAATSLRKPDSGQQANPGRMEEIKRLEAEVAQNPQNAAAWTELGNRYFDSDQPDKAVKAYEKAIEIKPGNPDVITDLGTMYRRMEQPKRAVEAFERAIAADPRHETARFNKGIVLLHDLNDTEGAIRSWEELVRINPGYTTPTGQKIKDMVDMYQSRAKGGGESKKTDSKSGS
ncbi:MAG: tetratricopeptide repeat protein [Pseudomonadota bacterium]